MNSVKCPQCGLVNFVNESNCKRCGADISKAAELVGQEQAARAADARRPNLFACPDCERMISRQAEACPYCGRFIQRIVKPELAKGAGNLAVIAIFVWLIAIFAGLFWSPAGFGLLIVALALDIRAEIIKSRQY